jgi:hypothetical protein
VLFDPPAVARVKGAFSVAGRYTPDAPGEYLVCAWIQDEFGASGPPVAASMTVRPPVLRIAASAPAGVSRGVPFEVTVDYQAEVPRYLTVLVVRAPRCPISSRTLGAIFGQPAVVADNVEVSGAGSATGTVEPVFRTCAGVGGRRHIRRVQASNVSCAAARSLARRWGARRRAPRRIGAYRCFARSGRVTCTAGTAQVRFYFGRR